LRRASLSALICSVALTACGSTVQLSEVPTSAGAPGDALTVPTSSAPSQVTTPSNASGSSDALGSAAPTAAPTHARSAPGGVGATPGHSTPRASVPSGSGPVRVGVLYLGGATALATSLGIKGLSTGDPVAQSKAIAKYINAHGGLAGRPIALYFGVVNTSAASSNVESAYGAACAQLVQDDKVAYVVSYMNLTASRLACYAKGGVTVLDDQSGVADPAGNANSATFAGPGELALGRASVTLVDDLWRRGWLTSKSKVGIFTSESPDGHLFASKYLTPALARHGLKPAATAFVSNDAGAANQGGTVLKFRASGVDRVIPIAANPLFLMESAQSQGYYPAYAMTSSFGPGALLETAAPKEQLRNSAGIGWGKFLDIGKGKMPPAVSSNETLCFRTMRSAGQQSSDATVKAFQTSLCNVMFFLEAASKEFGLGPDMLQRARAEDLAFPPADAFAIRLVPGQADGVGAYRDLAYQTSCNCFQYTSGNRSIS